MHARSGNPSRRQGDSLGGIRCRARDVSLALAVSRVNPWWPNGEGAQSLYTLLVRADGKVIAERRIGFKRVRWLPCEGGAEDALPWICEINRRAVFLQGVNWTPVQVDYPAVTKTQYASRIDLYRQMGANLLRVWGGAFLERESFYDLCDEAASSSGRSFRSRLPGSITGRLRRLAPSAKSARLPAITFSGAPTTLQTDVVRRQ